MRPRRSPAQWKKLMDQFAQSGVTQEQFCRSEGLAPATFALWRRKLKALAPVQAQPEFVEVHVPRGVDLVQAHSSEPAELIVELPYGVVLRFRGLAQ